MDVQILSFFHGLYEILKEMPMDVLVVTGILCNQLEIRRAWSRIAISYAKIFGRCSSHGAYGSGRSLVRMIASKLPRRPAKRCHFSTVQEEDFLCECKVDSCKTRVSSAKCSSANGGSRTNELRNGRLPSKTVETIEVGDFMNFCQVFTSGNVCGANASTPLHGYCLYSGCSAFLEAICQLNEQQFRILQEELVRIRSSSGLHMATNMLGTCKGVVPSKKLFSPTPIPPPPPLPPQPVYLPRKIEPVLKQVSSDEANDEIKMKPKLHPKTFHPIMNLPELLKDLKNVKLRTTVKSPGGTPLRPKIRCASPNDPAAIIEMALKKRFAHLHVLEETPENSENEESDDNWNRVLSP